ncbi:MAG: aspartate aminotransferase family protein [Pseudomonadota bacterium]
MSDALMPTYARVDLAFESGQGPYVTGSDGRRYLDFGAGIAVNALGYSHPHLVEALTRQANKVWHCSNLYRIPEGERLAERLCAASFAERAFFCNSGAEAMECGIKLIRKYHDDSGNPGRYKVITVEGAFHGRTLTTLAAAGNPKHLAGFAPEMPGFVHVAFGNLNELRAAIDDETAAILIEPVQGEGGIRPAEVDYMRALREICDEFGLLLFFDEIQCGMGRTGRLFAYQWAGIQPDVMALAKGLGGGFPIGACLATVEASKGLTPGTHGTTFGGNPLAMAVANAVLDVMLEDGFLSHVEQVGQSLRDGLEDLVARHPQILAEVRGRGLMLGLKAFVPNGELQASLRAEGLLTVAAADNVVRVLPPLIIEQAQVDEALEIIGRVCAGWAQAA